MLAGILMGVLPAQASEKTATVRAMQSIKNDQWTQARTLVQNSGDPLAAKLYYWMYARKEDENIEFSRLAKFIKDNPDWPGIGRLSEKAERLMPSNLGARAVLQWFDEREPETASGLIRYIDALLLEGQETKARNILTVWWSEKLTTRDEQKAIYIKFGRLIDMNAHRRRFDNLLFSEQYTNARAIAGVLGAGYSELAEARIALAEEKPEAPSLVARIPAKLQSDPGLLFERLRWRRKKNMDAEAMQILHNPPPSSQIINPEDWWREKHIIIRRLLEKRSYESAFLLADRHFQTEGAAFADAEWLAGWLALRFMNKPTRAYERFEAFHSKVQTPISKARAAYWAGRAAEKLKNPELARSWYTKAAQYQTVFYGQMAGAKLGMAHSLPNAAPPVLTEQDLQAFNADDLIRAANIMREVGLNRESALFMDAFIDAHKTPKAYLFAAESAAKRGEYKTAVKIAKEATKEGMFLTAQSYPVITNRLKNVDVEWAFVHAIIRQESMFDSDAVSPAGALGMMQVMPATAKEVARKRGLSQNIANLTANPQYNISLGTYYLDELLERYDGSYPLAIAAYNAGPGRVNKWLETYGDPRKGEVDLLDWIEMIPISETRNYVQRVMEGIYVYRLRLRNVQKPPVHKIHVPM